MYCLDTSVIIDLFNGVERIKKNIEQLEGSPLSITPIVLCELYKGAAHSHVTDKRLQFIKNLLQQVELLEFNQLSCHFFGDDYLLLKRAGKIVKDMDLMIAAVCKAHSKILITSDKKHFEHIADLKTEVW